MKLSKFVSVLCLVLVFAAMPVIVAHAAPALAPAAQETAAPLTLDDLLKTLQNMGGLAVLFAALTNAGKQFGWISDNNAPSASLIFNGAALLGLIALQLSGKFELVPVIDQGAGLFANALNSVLVLAFQLFISRKSHEAVLAGMPLVGKSFSGRRAGEGPAFEIND